MAGPRPRSPPDWKLDPGQLSRIMAEAFQRYPKLEYAYNLANLLNNHDKRRQVSSRKLSLLLRGKGKSDGDKVLDVEPEPLYAHNP